ncbi:M20 family peptidase [Rhodobacteraceae bacterium F11138]|nr:M20 family peptidase [Rhodobacteraceae bacterium F11138]
MGKLIMRLALGGAALIAVLIAVLAINTMRYSPQATAETDTFVLGADLEQATDLLSRAVRFQTVSTELDRPDFADFLGFLETTYPQVHATMERSILTARTPLYTWEGRNPALQPVLLAAHYDVVPVAEDSLDQWVQDPFGGAVSDGFVWGRGTLDDKGALIAILSAAEHLIGTGFQPERTIYLSFGGDEEVGGTGAMAVARHLTEKGVRLAWALDEGSFVLDQVVPGLEQPVASINLAEKGYVTLTLVAKGAGGHSSMPPRMTAVGRIARAVDRLQNAPVPGGLSGVSETFFDALGRHFTLQERVVFANRWLLNPVLENILSSSPSTDAMLRSTIAPTMLSGSAKDNVLATEATATINFRLHPRDSIDDIIAHVTRAVDDDQVQVVIDRDTASAASPVSSSTAQGYLDIDSSIRAAFGPLAVVPGLTIAATDARHYATAADNTYRIAPFKITNDDLARFHGINERLSIENLQNGINFYGALIRRQ